MANIQFPFQYQRLNRLPIDASDVFADLGELQGYIATGPAYAGQIVAVRNATNLPDLYRINEDFSYSALATKADVITGDTVNYSLEGVDTGVKWVDGSPIYRRVFITATGEYAYGQRVAIVDIPGGWAFHGLVKLDGYMIAVDESMSGETDYLPIGFRGGEADGAHAENYIHVWINSDGVIYETHRWEMFNDRPLILIVDYITHPVGTTSWDGGTTVWDNGNSAWDQFTRNLLIAASELRKARQAKLLTERPDGIRDRPDQTG